MVGTISELLYVQIKSILLSCLIDGLADILIPLCSVSPSWSMFFVLLFFSSLVALHHPFMFVNEGFCYLTFIGKVDVLSRNVFYSS